VTVCNSEVRTAADAVELFARRVAPRQYQVGQTTGSQVDSPLARKADRAMCNCGTYPVELLYSRQITDPELFDVRIQRITDLRRSCCQRLELWRDSLT
jgi:hypothetical protein